MFLFLRWGKMHFGEVQNFSWPEGRTSTFCCGALALVCCTLHHISALHSVVFYLIFFLHYTMLFVAYQYFGKKHIRQCKNSEDATKEWSWGEDTNNRCSDPADPRSNSWNWGHIRFCKTQDSFFQACDLKYGTETKILWFQGVLETCFQCTSGTCVYGCMICYGLLPILNNYTPCMAALQSYYPSAQHTTKCPVEAPWNKVRIMSCWGGKKIKALFKYLRSYLSEKRLLTLMFVRLPLWAISSCMSNFIELD